MDLVMSDQGKYSNIRNYYTKNPLPLWCECCPKIGDLFPAAVKSDEGKGLRIKIGRFLNPAPRSPPPLLQIWRVLDHIPKG